MQQTFTAGDFECYRKPARREHFLAEIDKVVPWDQLCQRIEPFYTKAGNSHLPVGLERILHIYFLQHWFNLLDPGAEEALYESRSSAVLPALTRAGSQCRTRLPSSNSDICWRSMHWESRYFRC